MASAGKRLNWCARCHHAIIRGEAGTWGHFSEDDWCKGELCICVSSLEQCGPQRGGFRSGPNYTQMIADEVARMRPRPRVTYGTGPYVPVHLRPLRVDQAVTGRLGSIT